MPGTIEFKTMYISICADPVLIRYFAGRMNVKLILVIFFAF